MASPINTEQQILAALGGVVGNGFDVAVTPTVTNGAYSAGDIMGALMTFSNVARLVDTTFMLQSAQIAVKTEQATTDFLLVLFNADPSSTTKTDNAAYSLAAADTFKAVCVLSFNSLGSINTDHGTPHTLSVNNLSRVMKPVSGTRDIYGLLIDRTGLTLGSTSDIQVRLSGVGV